MPIAGAYITVKITPTIIKVGNEIIESSSKTFSNILNAIKEKKQEKKKDKKKESKPTGNRVKDIHERLKKEGFKKVGQAGSHEKWKKGDKVVTVPNHGASHEIPIGTLRNIWRQAGWI